MQWGRQKLGPAIGKRRRRRGRGRQRQQQRRRQRYRRDYQKSAQTVRGDKEQKHQPIV